MGGGDFFLSGVGSEGSMLEVRLAQVARETRDAFSLLCLLSGSLSQPVLCYERDKFNKQILFLFQAMAWKSIPSPNREPGAPLALRACYSLCHHLVVTYRSLQG